jgi:hypothetical protein
MFIATEDDALRLLPASLSSIRRSVGVATLKDRVLSGAGAALLSCLGVGGRRLARMVQEHDA